MRGSVSVLVVGILALTGCGSAVGSTEVGEMSGTATATAVASPSPSLDMGKFQAQAACALWTNADEGSAIATYDDPARVTGRKSAIAAAAQAAGYDTKWTALQTAMVGSDQINFPLAVLGSINGDSTPELKAWQAFQQQVKLECSKTELP